MYVLSALLVVAQTVLGLVELKLAKARLPRICVAMLACNEDCRQPARMRGGLRLGELTASVCQTALLEGGPAGNINDQQCAIGNSAKLLELIESNRGEGVALVGQSLSQRLVASHYQDLGPLLAFQARRRPEVSHRTFLGKALRAGLSTVV
eukprot:13240479-Alexandrium_andersonii.AAC.1